MDKFTCPRRSENGMDIEDGPFRYAGKRLDTWLSDNTCSYCGSLNPAAFMERLEKGDVEITPTDKNYKTYLRGPGFQQAYRQCKVDCNDPNTCTHWAIREVKEIKFYFQHLAHQQRQRFLEMLNEKKLKVAYPGHFYVLPFFITNG